MIWGEVGTYSNVPEPLQGIAFDLLAMGQSNNLYGYTMNNPLIYVTQRDKYLWLHLLLLAGLEALQEVL